MMSVPVKVYDLDDTLCNFAEEFYKWMAHRHRLPKSHPNFECYDLLKPFHQQLPTDDDRVLHNWLMDFADYGSFDQMSPTRLMRKFREDILDPGCMVAVVTARAWMGEECAHMRTRDWFQYEGIWADQYDLVIPQHGENKATALIDYYSTLKLFPEVVYVADDVKYNLDCFKSIYGQSCEYVMPSKPWNRDCTEYNKIDVGGLIHG